jgi:hypothetical protein
MAEVGLSFLFIFFILKRKGNSDAPNFSVEQHFLMQVFMTILSGLPTSFCAAV